MWLERLSYKRSSYFRFAHFVSLFGFFTLNEVTNCIEKFMWQETGVSYQPSEGPQDFRHSYAHGCSGKSIFFTQSSQLMTLVVMLHSFTQSHESSWCRTSSCTWETVWNNKHFIHKHLWSGESCYTETDKCRYN